MRSGPTRGPGPRHGLARVLSKRGVCSRSQAERCIREGLVRLDGRVVLDPEYPTDATSAIIVVDGIQADAATPHYLMLNKPRGLVTTLSDERDRDTVYRCFDGANLGWIAPVGRLDKASEGLLLFSNDPAWAARITDPSTGPTKRYHVQVDCIPDVALLARIVQGRRGRWRLPVRGRSQLAAHGQQARVAGNCPRGRPQPPDSPFAGRIRYRGLAAGADRHRHAGAWRLGQRPMASTERG